MPGDTEQPAGMEPQDVMRLVRGHPEIDELVKRRHRAVLVRPNTADRGQPEGADQVVVGLYDYEQNDSLIALVDAKRRQVMAVERLDAQLQLSQEEREEAEALAAEDPRVAVFLVGRNMNPLTRLYFPPGGASQDRPHRHAIVFLRPSNVERLYAVVDLSARQVVGVLTRRQLTGR